MSDNITDSTVKKIQFCAVCKIAANKKCGGCNSVYYCSREHQKSDWNKLHAKNCSPIKLVIHPTIGRRCIATRRIEIDEIVLRENEPLIWIPRRTEKLTCLNCYRSLTIETAKQCDNCGWHLCCDCTKHGPECELTLRYRKKKVNINEYMSSGSVYPGAIVVMRALNLREKNPYAYEKFLSHESRCFEEAIECLSTSRGGRLDEAIWIKEYMNIDDVNIREIMKIIGIVEINASTFYLPTTGFIGVYDKVAYIEHNCRSNCRTIGHADGKVMVQAIRTIDKGQPLVICHLKVLYGTAIRGRSLEDLKYFTCKCERCKDPTELGTMFSAVKCINDNCKGYMLPSTFVVSRDEQIPNYICDRCGATMASEIVDKMNEDMYEEYKKIDRESVNELKKFIFKHEKVFHENYHGITEAKSKLIVEITKFDDTAPIEMLKETIILCEKMINLLEILAPEFYYDRGATLYRMYRSRNKLVLKEELSPTKFFSFMKEQKKILTEAFRLLRDDPLTKELLKMKVLEDLDLTNIILNVLKGDPIEH